LFHFNAFIVALLSSCQSARCGGPATTKHRPDPSRVKATSCRQSDKVVLAELREKQQSNE